MISGTVKLRRGSTLAAGEVQPMGQIENGGLAENDREGFCGLGLRCRLIERHTGATA
jgi:hypothetical protein